MEDFSIYDEFGRCTKFHGDRLINESTDTDVGNKPQWLDLTVWRTASKRWVVRRKTHYRVRHLSERCDRADGYELVPPTELDTYPCGQCNRAGSVEPGRGFAQASRVVVEVYTTTPELIESFAKDGKFSNLSRTILSDLAEQDSEVDDLWTTVVVP